VVAVIHVVGAKMFKGAIAVYNPQDPLEKALFNACYKFEGSWLTSFESKLLVRAVESLKSMSGEWLEEEELYESRAEYFFAHDMNTNKFVLPINYLYLRDILENKVVSNVLCDPVTFVTEPIAHFLFRHDYDIHLIFDEQSLIDLNKSSFMRVGGLLISEDTIKIPDKFKAVVHCPNLVNEVNKLIEEITPMNSTLMKAAAHSSGDGIFALDTNIEKNLKANDKVMDKKTKQYGVVIEVQPGITGNVDILYSSGDRKVIRKSEFDLLFVKKI